ncbi:hypothetical protein ACT0K6_000166 [Enterococcus faecalis]|uniref:hypothetical protein n=1 Tax=Enterococcus faecalis TaxID=1351 RepID=UPI000CF17032|nr:hypothetical protein [Enterococcus faecalis]MBO6372964.1 hypothetical protein [Enterococcus faecalis]MDN3096589.1 hypothetical protein [Enterococcus faecalis]PQD11480.1 hypothetical protein CUM65_04060 [Enterococcus faecalis]PQG37174.1 hypothetical protein CUS34_10825 [Enterococcus faecalis]RXV23839.1 hypothetical protein CYQ36_02005 [Enterococcus faecalis]
MKQKIVLGSLFVLLFLLVGCGGNKIAGIWVQYSDYSEKDKTVYEIDAKKHKMTISEYSNGEIATSSVKQITVDEKDKTIKEKGTELFTETIPYLVDHNQLTLDSEVLYKEGSKEDKEAHKKEDEEKLNEAILGLEKRLNNDFLKNYQGVWYSGEGIDTDSFMPATTINQLIVDTKGMSTQDVYIEVYENKPRKVEKKESTNYTFSGIQLPSKHEYTEESESNSSFSYGSSNVDYELPSTIKEIESLKTIDEFAKYEANHNIRELSFGYQSNGGNVDDTSIILNVNDLTHIESTGSMWSNSTYKKELPTSTLATDFN